MPVGSLLWPSQAVSEGLVPQKHRKTICVLRFLLIFEVLDDPRGLIVASLGPTWSKTAPQSGPKINQTNL